MTWNGEHGKTIFFQNEMPYDPPSQDTWMPNGVNGFAADKVACSVVTNEAWGKESYSFFNGSPGIHATHAFAGPGMPGVKLCVILTVFLSGLAGINNESRMAKRARFAIPGSLKDVVDTV